MDPEPIEPIVPVHLTPQAPVKFDTLRDGAMFRSNRYATIYIKLGWGPLTQDHNNGTGCSGCKYGAPYTWNAVSTASGGTVHFCKDEEVYPFA